ncbi:MAG: ABC transporter ATP-binding protein [Verrucomicrobiae bacterium]|nr:ABC transporter ATP-binding protein [Verrucomicrobiae bacterium]
MILLENLTKRFGDLTAVNDLTLEVRPGEFFVVLGPNAAGKTTTIKMMAGLIRPDQGRAVVGGFDIQKQPVEARKIMSYVPDFPFMYEKLTPTEFIRFVGDLFGVPRGSIEEKSEEMIAYFNLGEYRHELIENLSHGTRQRVAIAAALLHDPKVFVIDEPMVGLDPKHARLVKDILRKRTRERGMTVFLSTHQLSMAEELADRIGIIHRGRLLALGTPAEILSRSGSDTALEDVFLRITQEEVPGL